MRRLVGDVREERLAVAAVGVDVGDQLVGVGLRRVEVLRQALQVAPVLGVERLGVGGREVPVVPVAAHPVEQREVALEAARGRDLGRLLPQVPLADHVGVVAGVLQELRQRGDAVVEVALVAVQAHLVRRRKLAHVAEAVEVRVHAREEHRPGGRAARVRVEVREPHAALGQGVEVRRLDLAAERAHVGEAHVVAEDDDDVRPAVRLGRGGVCESGEQAGEAEDGQPARAAGPRRRASRRGRVSRVAAGSSFPLPSRDPAFGPATPRPRGRRLTAGRQASAIVPDNVDHGIPPQVDLSPVKSRGCGRSRLSEFRRRKVRRC